MRQLPMRVAQKRDLTHGGADGPVAPELRYGAAGSGLLDWIIYALDRSLILPFSNSQMAEK